MYQVNQADVIEWANAYQGEPFHALLCDPPYELNFMNRKWDNTGISFRKEVWEAFARIMYPGAFGMAFGGSRTAHRIAVAIEDAGFIIHPMIGWVYGSGFPKATRLDTRIDAEAGAERTKSGIKHTRNVKPYDDENGWNDNNTVGDFEYTLPSTDLAKAWVGHRYGLQALKPAMEPIIVFQKPYEGRPIDSITETGAGALNIDGSRIGTEAVISNRWTDDAHPFGGGAGNQYETVHNHGRWPANVVLSHHPDCKLRDYLDDEENGECFAVWECVDGCAVKQMGKQSGNNKSSGGRSGHDAAYGGGYKQEYYGAQPPGLGDSGTAARYFYNADWMYERTEEDDGFLYCAKANRTERDAGMAEERNHHPSVKPIALAQHLATLLLPPIMYAPRRILVPFSGSGSEMIGCLRAGYEHIDGIEYEQEYCEIAHARLEYWRKIPIQRQLLPNP